MNNQNNFKTPDQIESLANAELLKTFEQESFVPPINLELICQKNDIQLRFANFGDNNIDGLIDVNGVYEQTTKAKQSILINSNLIRNPRANFTIAHELGHYFMHKEVLDKTDVDVLYRSKGLNEFTFEEMKREQEANIFASFLLMPTSAIEFYLNLFETGKVSKSLDEMAKTFAVSTQALKIRLENYKKKNVYKSNNFINTQVSSSFANAF